MNDSYPDQIRGKIGELLLQIRLFENQIESSIPVLDSGNDIIALKGKVVKSIQVKTKRKHTRNWDLRNLPPKYDFVALIEFASDEFMLDAARIFILSKTQVRGRKSIVVPNSSYEISFDRLRLLFRE